MTYDTESHFIQVFRIKHVALFLFIVITMFSLPQFSLSGYPSNYDPSRSGYYKVCFASEIVNIPYKYFNQLKFISINPAIEFMKTNTKGFDFCSNWISGIIGNAFAKNTGNGTEPDRYCMFDPSLPKCAADENGTCPEGFGRNAYHQCFPFHYEGCPKGYHSHEDDESGRCIPNSEKCEEGYIMAPDYPECQNSESVCKEFPNTIGCKPNDNDLGVTTNNTLR